MSAALSVPPALGYFPILHQMVDSGHLKTLHARAPALYLAIKRFADYQSGRAEVSNKKILRVTGMSKPTFYLARQSLKEHGYIDFDDSERPTAYTIFEQINYYTSDKRPAGLGVVPYVPSQFRAVLDALKGRALEPGMAESGICIGGLRVVLSVRLDGDLSADVRVGVAVDKGEPT